MVLVKSVLVFFTLLKTVIFAEKIAHGHVFRFDYHISYSANR